MEYVKKLKSSDSCKSCHFWDTEDKRGEKCWCMLHDEIELFTSPNGVCSSFFYRVGTTSLPNVNRSFQFACMTMKLKQDHKRLKESATNGLEYENVPLNIPNVLSNAFASMRRHGNTKLAEVWRDAHGNLRRHRRGRKGFKWFLLAKATGNTVSIIVYSNNVQECVNWLINYFESRNMLESYKKMALATVYKDFSDMTNPPTCFFVQSQRISRKDIRGYQVTKQGIHAFIHDTMDTEGQQVEELEEHEDKEDEEQDYE